MDKSFDSLTLPLLAGVLAIALVIGIAFIRRTQLIKKLRRLPGNYGTLLGFKRVESSNLPEWWVGEIEGRPVGITAVTAPVSGFDHRASHVLVLRVAVGIRRKQPLDFDFRYHFPRPLRPEPSLVFEKHAYLATEIKSGILEFLQSWSGLYIGRISKLQRDPPRQFQDVLAHDTLSTDLSIEELKTRIQALAKLAKVIEGTEVSGN